MCIRDRTNIDNWSNCARLLIFPPRTEIMQEHIKVMTNKLLLISIIESGQLKLAIDTQARAVMVPIPWEIIKAGGMIIDNGLSPDPKKFFIAWTNNRREIIKRICLELIVGFSFLETNIKKPQLIRTSKKDTLQEKITELCKDGTSSSLKEEIMAITIHIRKIINLSIVEIWIGSCFGTWLLFQK